MGDGPEIKFAILDMNVICGCLAKFEQALPSYDQGIVGAFLNVLEEMTPCCSLDDNYFLRLVRFFSVTGSDSVLCRVLDKVFATLVVTRYIASAVSPICA
jgi:hypothetical protein